MIDIDHQISLDPSSSQAENLEAVAPLIKSIQDADSEQLYLRALDNFVEEKEREIEKICEGNYEVRHALSPVSWAGLLRSRTLFLAYRRC